MVIDKDIANTNERVAQMEQWCHDHEDRHSRDHAELILAKQNEVTLAAASAHPVDAVLKWAAGVCTAIIGAGIGALSVWFLKR